MSVLLALQGASPPQAYTLDALPGTYTIAGAATQFTVARNLNALPGSYSITGFASQLAVNRGLSASPGAYTVTGSAGQFVVARNLLAASGAFTITGSAGQFAVNRTLPAAPGTFTITGVAASFVRAVQVLVGPGAYVVAGESAAFTVARELPVGPGSYTISGFAADFTVAASGPVAYVLDVLPGAYLLTGFVAEFVAPEIRRISSAADAFAPMPWAFAQPQKGGRTTAPAPWFDHDIPAAISLDYTGSVLVEWWEPATGRDEKESGAAGGVRPSPAPSPSVFDVPAVAVLRFAVTGSVRVGFVDPVRIREADEEMLRLAIGATSGGDREALERVLSCVVGE